MIELMRLLRVSLRLYSEAMRRTAALNGSEAEWEKRRTKVIGAKAEIGPGVGAPMPDIKSINDEGNAHCEKRPPLRYVECLKSYI